MDLADDSSAKRLEAAGLGVAVFQTGCDAKFRIVKTSEPWPADAIVWTGMEMYNYCESDEQQRAIMRGLKAIR